MLPIATRQVRNLGLLLALTGLLAGGSALASAPAAPGITTPPANTTVTAPATATFTVVATGTAPTYQWKKNNANVVGGTGATTASYTTPATSSADDGASYTVVVTDAGTSITSAPATLTVIFKPVISTQPGPTASIVEGQTATFTVAATGNALTYQWKLNGTTNVGTNSASYTTPPAVLGDNNAKYTVVITNAGGTTTSNQAILTVGAATAVTITTQPPANRSILVGQTTTYNVVATGSTPITYQWQKNLVNVTSGSGGTTNTYTIPPAQASDDGNSYRCIVSNVKGPVNSQPGSLTVGAATPVGIATSRPTRLHSSGRQRLFPSSLQGQPPTPISGNGGRRTSEAIQRPIRLRRWT